MEDTIKAYKGFDKNFQCRGYQFAVGEVYEIKEEPILCERGFHACTTPVDVLRYYGAHNSRYAEVEIIGEFLFDKEEDSKIVTKKIRIIKEISYLELWNAQREWNSISELCASATGNYGHASATGNYGNASATGYSGHASATGYYGHASATGDYGHASATGDYGHASATGYYAVAIAIGFQSKARAKQGNWIVLARYDRNRSLIEVKTAKIDGDTLKENTYYTLDGDGNFVEYEEK